MTTATTRDPFDCQRDVLTLDSATARRENTFGGMTLAQRRAAVAKYCNDLYLFGHCELYDETSTCYTRKAAALNGPKYGDYRPRSKQCTAEMYNSNDSLFYFIFRGAR